MLNTKLLIDSSMSDDIGIDRGERDTRRRVTNGGVRIFTVGDVKKILELGERIDDLEARIEELEKEVS